MNPVPAAADSLAGRSELFHRARVVLDQLGRPTADSALDQCPATIATVLKRAGLIQRLSLEGKCKNLLLLGDDDLLSIALFTIGYNSVTVVDADLRILTTIADATSRGVTTIHADLRDGLPSDLYSSFDAVFTDPPYTLAGQLLFISCGLSSLERGLCRLFLCASEFYLNGDAMVYISSFLRSAGFSLESQRKYFNEYPASADVQCDLIRAERYNQSSLFSDLYCFKGRLHESVPPIPANLKRNIYEYGGIDGAS